MDIRPVSGLRARYVSDAVISLEWDDAQPYDGVLVEYRRGVEWKRYANAGSSGRCEFVHAEPNGCYVFRAVAFVGGDLAAPAYSNAVCTTPAPPTRLEAVRNGDNTVTLAIGNDAQEHAEATELQRLPEGGGWEPASTVDPSLPSFVDEFGGPCRYRARNVASGLCSAWTETEFDVPVVAPPAPPSLSHPADGAIVALDDGPVAVEWAYNTVDGSPQEAAEVCYGFGDDLQVASVGAETRCEVPLRDGMAEMSVKVRCKGAADGYSGWSAPRTVNVKKRPRVVVSSVEASRFPAVFEFDVFDESGAMAYAVAKVSRGGEAVCEKVVRDARVVLGESELPLSDGAEYVFEATVVSTSTLSGTGAAAFVAEFDAPAKPDLYLKESDGAVELFARPGKGSPVETRSIAVFRANPDGTSTALGGAGVSVRLTDRIPPLDAEVEYRAVAYADDGSQAASVRKTVVRSDGRIYFNWGEGFSECAYCWRKASFDVGAEVESKTFRVLGRRSPMVFFGEQESVSPSVSAQVPIAGIGHHDRRGTTEAFRELGRHRGVACLRLPYSRGFKAFVACSVKTAVDNERYLMADLSVACEEVDHGLA